MNIFSKIFAKGRLYDLLSACATIAIGLWIRSFKEGTFYLKGFLAPRFVWILIVIFGVFILIQSFRNRKIPTNENEFVKCTNCKKSFYKTRVQDDICPKCGSVVEEIDGYFERHPNEKPFKDIENDNKA